MQADLKHAPELLGDLVRVPVLHVQHSQGSCQTRNGSSGVAKRGEKSVFSAFPHKHQTCSALHIMVDYAQVLGEPGLSQSIPCPPTYLLCG